MSKNSCPLGASVKPDMNQRGFLHLVCVSVSSFVASIFVSTAWVLRSAKPLVLPDRSPRFKIGTPDLFPPGTIREFPRQKVALFSDDEGMHAISTVCTHLGCVVGRHEKGFDCPCHGSKFDLEGRVIGGPAPGGLPWLRIEKLPSGHLTVDAGSYVPLGTKFRVS